MGKLLFSESINTPSYSFSCANVAKGIYVINVYHKGIWSRQKMFIK